MCKRPRQSAKGQIGQKYLRSLIRAFAVLMSHLPILNFTKGKGRRLRLNRCEGGSVFTGKICPKTHSLMAQLICHHLQLSYRQKTIKVQSTNTLLVRSLKRPLLLNQPASFTNEMQHNKPYLRKCYVKYMLVHPPSNKSLTRKRQSLSPVWA